MKQKSFRFDDDDEGWGVGGQVETDGGWDYPDYGGYGKMPTIHRDIFFGAEEPIEAVDSAPHR